VNRFDGFRLSEVSNSSGDFKNAGDDTGGEIEFCCGGFDEGLGFVCEGDVFFDVLRRNFGVGFVMCLGET